MNHGSERFRIVGTPSWLHHTQQSKINAVNIKKNCQIQGAASSPSSFSEIKLQISLSQAAMFWDYEHEWLLPSTDSF